MTYYAAIAAGNLGAPDRAVALLETFLNDTGDTAAFEKQLDHARRLVQFWSKAARAATRKKKAAHTAPKRTIVAPATPVAPAATTRSTSRQTIPGLLDFEAREPAPSKTSARHPIPPAPAVPEFPEITLPPPVIEFELVREGFPDVIAIDTWRRPATWSCARRAGFDCRRASTS